MTDFIQTLVTMRSGQVALDINSKFSQVLAGVLETGGKGELIIKLKVAPSEMAAGGGVVQVEIQHEAKLKVPELKIGKSTFFVTSGGELTRDDPAQALLYEEVQQEIKQEAKRG